MKFEEVVGQDDIKTKLVAQVNAGKSAHAILFAGNEGTGGLAMALALSQFLVCEKRNNATSNDGGLFGAATHEPVLMNDSCGVCPACNKSAKLIHPDIHFTFPAIKKDPKDAGVSSEFINEWRQAVASQPYMNLNDWMQSINAENKQGNINTAECKEIIRQISLKSFESPFKIQIIWMGETLRESGNILLKLIEEPPANTIFILVVEQIDLVLPTVLSRTQIVKLPPISVSSIENYLQNAKNIAAENANKIARLADGNVRMAIQLTELQTNEYHEILQKWFSASARLLSSAKGEASSTLGQLTENFQKMGRENQKGFLLYASWFLREILLLSQNLNSEKLLDEELSYAQKVATRMDVQKVKKMNSLLNDSIYHIERNSNPKVTFYSLSFKLCHIFNE
jgi:DNA polymerase-3 subunit delta'